MFFKTTWKKYEYKENVYQSQSLSWWADEDQIALLIADINSHLHLSCFLSALEGQQTFVMRDTTGPSRRWTNTAAAETENKCLLNGAIVSNIRTVSLQRTVSVAQGFQNTFHWGQGVMFSNVRHFNNSESKKMQYHSNSTASHKNWERQINVPNIIKKHYLGTAFCYGSKVLLIWTNFYGLFIYFPIICSPPSNFRFCCHLIFLESVLIV